MTVTQVTANVEAGIVEVLNGCQPSPFAGRIFPKTRGTCDQYPNLVYNRVSTNSYDTHDDSGGLVWARFQLDIYAKSYPDMVAASNAVLSCLRGFKGVAAGCRFSALLITASDHYDGGTGIYRMRQDYRITYNEKLVE